MGSPYNQVAIAHFIKELVFGCMPQLHSLPQYSWKSLHAGHQCEHASKNKSCRTCAFPGLGYLPQLVMIFISYPRHNDFLYISKDVVPAIWVHWGRIWQLSFHVTWLHIRSHSSLSHIAQVLANVIHHVFPWKKQTNALSLDWEKSKLQYYHVMQSVRILLNIWLRLVLWIIT